jgi:hypothetical protein
VPAAPTPAAAAALPELGLPPDPSASTVATAAAPVVALIRRLPLLFDD